MENLRKLERGRTLTILLLLSDGRKFSTQIYEYMHEMTFEKARAILLELGLIEKTDDPNSRRIYYNLTGKGKKVAELVCQIAEVLG